MKIEIENTVENKNKLFALRNKYKNSEPLISLFYLSQCYTIFEKTFWKLREILNKAKIKYTAIYNDLA